MPIEVIAMLCLQGIVLLLIVPRAWQARQWATHAPPALKRAKNLSITLALLLFAVTFFAAFWILFLVGLYVWRPFGRPWWWNYALVTIALIGELGPAIILQFKWREMFDKRPPESNH